MSRKLRYNVHVVDEDGNGAVYGPHSDNIPASVAKQITNPSAWDDGDDETPAVPAPETQDLGTGSDSGGPGGTQVSEADVKPYDELNANDLKAEVQRRNEGREGDAVIKPAGKSKAKLIEALQADDQQANGQA